MTSRSPVMAPQPFASGITLPLAFSRVTPASLPATRLYVTACIEFLTSPLVSSILECHPNDIAVHGPRPEWQTWWEWAAAGIARWKLLVPGWFHDIENTSSGPSSNIPAEIRKMLETIDQLTLPRTPNCEHILPSSEEYLPLRGMSPKKSHEVSQMSALIKSLVSQHQINIRHIVDVGAGQGYLSRALCDHPLSMNVLALDYSEVQTKGAERRNGNIEKKLAKMAAKRARDCDLSDSGGVYPSSHGSPISAGKLTHEMIHITPRTLQGSVSRWISSQSTSTSPPTPVMFVALHACGTLTPDILRCFVAYSHQMRLSPTPENPQRWYAAGLAVVGCCYNLMSPNSDFPLSALVAKEAEISRRRLNLSYNHRSLAAQSPLQWKHSQSTRNAAELAVRKIVYRALFGKLTASRSSINAAVSSDERPGKIGRLRDSVYTSLGGFISEANKKLGTKAAIPGDEENDLMSCLEVLHTLRSMIGPVVESLIIVDRYLYLAEQLQDSVVLALNLFDQERGSGRNVALVVLPSESTLYSLKRQIKY